MSASRRPLKAWVPPLLLGLALAMVAEVGAFLLLYSGQGFLRALSVVLAVESGALAVGLWSAAVSRDEDVVSSVGRRWLFALVTFSAAAVTSAAWQLVDGLGASRLGQALGLALLCGLPLLAGGGLAGTLARPDAGLGPARGSRGPSPGALLALGVTFGFVLTGALLRTAITPPSLLLGCVVALSGGALVHARVLATRRTVSPVDVRATPRGEVRVEDVTGGPRRGVRVLRVEGVVRGARFEGGDPALPDEAEILRRVTPGSEGPHRLLFLGGGTFLLPDRILALLPGARAVVVEPESSLPGLARRYFGLDGDGAPSGEEGRLRSVEAEVLDREAVPPGPWDLVVLDGAALAPGRPVPLFLRSELEWLRSLLGPGGRLVIRRLRGPPGDDGRPLEALARQAGEVFSRVVLLKRSEEEAGSGLESDDRGSWLLVLGGDAGASEPDAPSSWLREEGGEAWRTFTDPADAGLAVADDPGGP